MGYSDMIANLDLAASILDEYFPQVKYTLYNTGEYTLELEDRYVVQKELPLEEGLYRKHLQTSVAELYSYKVMDDHEDTFMRLADED
jgi:hypothetical protein